MVIEAAFAVVGFGLGAVVVGLVTRRPEPPAAPALPLPTLEVVADPPAEAPGEKPVEPQGASHLIGLLVQALREPLRQLRRSEGAPSEAVERIERLAWQARMLTAQPRPMKASPISPSGLLREAAEEVPALRDGHVAVSWSLLNRQPVELDPERTRAAFRELLAAGAEAAERGGRIAVKVQPGGVEGFPVQVELEIGRRGAEADSLPLLVARRLLEHQGARVEVDAAVTRVLLRDALPEEAAVA